jgi:hypothetical protein
LSISDVFASLFGISHLKVFLWSMAYGFLMVFLRFSSVFLWFS